MISSWMAPIISPRAISSTTPASLPVSPMCGDRSFGLKDKLRYFGRRAPGGIGLNYRDLYPEPPPPEMAPSCAEGGVLGILCASIGAIMATEAVKLITGLGETLLGRLIVYDALDMTYRCIPLRRDPTRQAVSELIDYRAFCSMAPTAATRDAKFLRSARKSSKTI